eukprot:jgi/Ulvmu1/4143/UM019_0122.1
MLAKGSVSNRLAFTAVILGILSVNAVAYPFWATCVSATQVYIGVSHEALRWMIYSSALIAMPSILITLPGIRCLGLASCTRCATLLSFVGCSLRSIAAANGHGPRRSTSAYIWVQLGSVVTCTALAPMAICGSLIASAESSRRARLWRHIAVIMAHPLGLALGALLPELLKRGPLLSAAEADATLLLFMSISAATAICVLALLWRAFSLLEVEQPADQAMSLGTPSTVLALRSTQHARPDQVSCGGQQSKPNRTGCCSAVQQFTADVLPQLVKLLRTPKLVLVAVSFAFLVAPMLAAFGGMSIMIRDGQIFHGLPQKLIFAAFIITGVAAPFIMPFFFRDYKVGAVGLVVAHFCMVALALGYAFALAFEPAPEDELPQSLVAAIALAAAVTAALDLERAVDIVHRERPAVVAGLLWLAAYVVTVLICGAQELLLFRASVSSADAMQWWKWIMVLCFAIGAASAVAGVWVSTNQVQAAGETAEDSSAGEGMAQVEGSCTIDALHSGSSHPKAVWWQNAAASSEGTPRDVVAYVLRGDT